MMDILYDMDVHNHCHKDIHNMDLMWKTGQGGKVLHLNINQRKQNTYLFSLINRNGDQSLLRS